MSDYAKLDVRQLPKTSQLTAEDRHWRSFKVRRKHNLALAPAASLHSHSPLCLLSPLSLLQNPVVHRHFVKVTDLQFNPITPHDLAACASTRVCPPHPDRPPALPDSS